MNNSRISRRYVFPLAMLLLFFLFGVCSFADEGGLERCLDATCRVRAGGSVGSGCVFASSRTHLFVLTAAHVLENASQVECEFWQNGQALRRHAANVALQDTQEDVAVLALTRLPFGEQPPTIIPLAASDEAAKPETTLLSVGCANGAWATAWQGRIITRQQDAIRFLPPPAEGRSGSAIFDAEGKNILGIILARGETSTTSVGIARSAEAIRNVLVRHKLTPQSTTTTAGCDNGRCGLLLGRQPVIPQQPAQQVQPILLPNTSQGSDLLALGSKLDKIAELIEDQKKERLPGETTEETSKLRRTVEQLLGDRETLLSRISARIESVKQEGAGSPLAIAKAYAADLAKEKLTDGSAGLGLGKLLAMMLGISGPLGLALGGGLWMVSRRIGAKVESGEPLIIQKLLDKVLDKGLKEEK